MTLKENERHERGELAVDIGRALGLEECILRSIRANADKIKSECSECYAINWNKSESFTIGNYEDDGMLGHMSSTSCIVSYGEITFVLRFQLTC